MPLGMYIPVVAELGTLDNFNEEKNFLADHPLNFWYILLNMRIRDLEGKYIS